MEYRGFKIVDDGYGYRIYTDPFDFDCGYFHTYNEAVSVIDRFYTFLEV